MWVLAALAVALLVVNFMKAPTAPDYRRVHRAMEVCGYIPHGISDVAWELYARGKAPLGTAYYYTRAVNSRNHPAAVCMRERLEP